jgi:hypothetical protein
VVSYRTGNAPPIFEKLAVMLFPADGYEAVVLSCQGKGVRTAAFFGEDGARLDAGFFGGEQNLRRGEDFDGPELLHVDR